MDAPPAIAISTPSAIMAAPAPRALGVDTGVIGAERSAE
jgi:hypothetical protein